jgi:uncharacterized protein YceK
MNYRLHPYRFRPRRHDRMQLADKILIAILIFFAAVCLLPSTGCGTYMARCTEVDVDVWGDLYPATQVDFFTAAGVVAYDAPIAIIPAVWVCSLVDLPFSLATDTLLLPYDVIKNNTTKGDTP